MSFLKFLSHWRSRILAYFVIFIVTFMVIAVLWQVFTRLALRNPAVWTEESSTYLLMWCGLLGASYAYGKGAHVGMEYFASRLITMKRKILDLVITILVSYFAYKVMLMGGINYVKVAFINNQLSPTMNIPTGYLNLCLPLSGFFILTYCIEFIVNDILFLLGKKE